MNWCVRAEKGQDAPGGQRWRKMCSLSFSPSPSRQGLVDPYPPSPLPPLPLTWAASIGMESSEGLTIGSCRQVMHSRGEATSCEGGGGRHQGMRGSERVHHAASSKKNTGK